MIERFALRMLLVAFACQLNLPVARAQAPSSVETPTAAKTENGIDTNKVFQPVTPGPADGRIALVSARMLEQIQYLKEPFNDAISSKFLDRYLETLDPQHLHFIQSDLDQFERFRTNLDNLTLSRTGIGDTRPACEIFNRFVERLEQRVAYTDELLKNEKFVFDTDERITVNRHELPYPKDLTEARQLWRQRVRFEYLQEKLAKIEARKKEAEKPAEGKKETVTEAGLKKSDAEQIVETLSNRYHRNLRTFKDWDNEDVLQIYLTALAHVYDPHSDYFGRSQLESFAIGMNLSLFGIGAELTSQDGYCTIRRLLPGGPALKSKKIQEKDRIVAVGQSNQPPVDVVDMSLNKAVQLIRGPKGTEVRLTILPAESSAQKVVSLTRDEIKLEDQEAKARLIEMPGSQGTALRVGVIDLPSFYASFDPANRRGKAENKSTTADVAKLLTKLKAENVNGVVLDLRRNGGGSLEEAIHLTGLFIKEGPVVQVCDADGTVQEDDDTDPSVLYDGPLIVLTSRFSASASEILAGALQDYGRALIVGDSSTHGKGTVQSVNTLTPYMRVGSLTFTNDPGALKITIKKFYRASGASTQLKGVVPDVILPSVLSESKDIGETALENPLPWDTIPSSRYDRLDMVQPYLTDLRKRSADRIAKDQEYIYIHEDIERFKKQQAAKTISLNEQERLKEKEEIDAIIKARDKERLARSEPQEKVYEISLKLADLPGLPPPVAKTNTLAKAASDSMNATGAVTKASAAGAHDNADDAEDPEAEKTPLVDAPMVEAEHIMVDYLSLLAHHNVAVASPTLPGK